ncbi:hypothetical protein EMIT0P218_430009 [Pseudomonas sp. IT-P218]
MWLGYSEHISHPSKENSLRGTGYSKAHYAGQRTDVAAAICNAQGSDAASAAPDVGDGHEQTY